MEQMAVAVVALVPTLDVVIPYVWFSLTKFHSFTLKYELC